MSWGLRAGHAAATERMLTPRSPLGRGRGRRIRSNSGICKGRRVMRGVVDALKSIVKAPAEPHDDGYRGPNPMNCYGVSRFGVSGEAAFVVGTQSRLAGVIAIVRAFTNTKSRHCPASISASARTGPKSPLTACV